MKHLLAGSLILMLLTVPGRAEERPQGLLWNRSGLPATLPLQIKTGPGDDYLLHLRDMETGDIVLAAYIRGGEFFRVLVPPGSYELQFASGSDWQGETDLFGPNTRRFVLDPALSFGATESRKEGHLVDLVEMTARDFSICQGMALDLESLLPPKPPAGRPFPPQEEPPEGFPPRKYPIPRYDMVSRICD